IGQQRVAPKANQPERKGSRRQKHRTRRDHGRTGQPRNDYAQTVTKQTHENSQIPTRPTSLHQAKTSKHARLNDQQPMPTRTHPFLPTEPPTSSQGQLPTFTTRRKTSINRTSSARRTCVEPWP